MRMRVRMADGSRRIVTVERDAAVPGLLWTAEDRAFLREIHVDIGVPAEPMQPEPVVAMEQYCAAVDAADFVIRQNYCVRRQRRQLMARLRLARSIRQGWWSLAAIVAACGLGILLVVLCG